MPRNKVRYSFQFKFDLADNKSGLPVGGEVSGEKNTIKEIRKILLSILDLFDPDAKT